MAVQFKKIPNVAPWPTRRKPQARFDEEVKASMDQMSVMVPVLNELIDLLNQWADQIERDTAAAQQAAANAKASEEAARASQNAAKTSETNAKASENAARASQTAAKTSETNAKNSEIAAIRAQNNAAASEAAALRHAQDAQATAGEVREFQNTALEDYARVKLETEKAMAAAAKAQAWAEETRAGAEVAGKVMESVTAVQRLQEEALEARDESFENRCQASARALCARMDAEMARVCHRAVRAEREAQVDVRYMEALAGFQEQLARLSDRVTQIGVEEDANA